MTYEALVSVTVSGEVAESLLAVKVLKLNNHVGEDIASSLHKLVHELGLDGVGRTLLSETQVEGVLEVVLVVCTAVQNDGESLVGVDTGGTGVEGELANLWGRGSARLHHLASGPSVGIRGFDLQRYRHR